MKTMIEHRHETGRDETITLHRTAETIQTAGPDPLTLPIWVGRGDGWTGPDAHYMEYPGTEPLTDRLRVDTSGKLTLTPVFEASIDAPEDRFTGRVVWYRDRAVASLAHPGQPFAALDVWWHEHDRAIGWSGPTTGGDMTEEDFSAGLELATLVLRDRNGLCAAMADTNYGPMEC